MQNIGQAFILDPNLVSAAHSKSRVSGFTHEFYRYPARFSPVFARAVIQEFTRPGDWVYDPFMGGGTTLVEAAALGRHAIGTDINALSVFISRVKTRIYSKQFFRDMNVWARSASARLDLRRQFERPNDWIEAGYQRNLSTRKTWHIRKLIELSLEEISRLPTLRHKDFARCTILRTAQWALDCRERIPQAAEYREALRANTSAMVLGATEFAQSALTNRNVSSGRTRVICLHRSAAGIETDPRVAAAQKPQLILTSPPYPGVHVLYHRWQIHGRRETPAPFWIANRLDGVGSAYYTFGDRRQEGLKSYFDQVAATFASLKSLAAPETLLVQLVAFSDMDWQLPKYLDTMATAGWQEVLPHIGCTDLKSRLWRDVPNRRWYASMQAQCESGREVVLFHQPHTNQARATTCRSTLQ